LLPLQVYDAPPRRTPQCGATGTTKGTAVSVSRSRASRRPSAAPWVQMAIVSG